MSRGGKSVPANLLPNGKSLTATGMASEDTATPDQKAKAVAKAAPQIVEEMASIDLGEPIATASAATAAVATRPAQEAAPKVEEFAATGDTSSWYLRVMFNVDTGVVANVIQALGRHRVKIDAMSEKRQNGSQVKMVLVMLTDQVSDEALSAALADLKAMPVVVGSIKKIKLEYLSPGMFG